MHFNPVRDLAQRVIFPNGLTARQASRGTRAVPNPGVVSAVGSPLRDALDRYNPVAPVLQRVMPSELDMTLVAPPRRGWFGRVFRPESRLAAGVPPAVQKSAEAVTAGSKSSAFKVTRTRHVENGFEVIGYPRWKGLPLPLRTRVHMRLGAGSDGSWALWPEQVSVWGVASAKLRDAVKQALRGESKLQADGDRFRIMI